MQPIKRLLILYSTRSYNFSSEMHEYVINMQGGGIYQGDSKTIQAIEDVFRVCIAWYKHEKGWENSRPLCKPETKSRVCITVENSPNASSVYIRLCKHRKKVFYCFYKITFPKQNAKLLVWQWLKEKFSPVAKSCPRRLASVISSCFAKRCFPKYGLFSLKMSASAKKIDTLSW